jgi:poly-gamma-glutamate synthesis protein (capsule biosynthesis protein)
MKRLVLVCACAAAIVLALSTRESRFEYVQPEQEKPIVVQDSTTTLLFVGDVMLGRNLEVLRKKYGPDHAFQYIDDTLASVESVVANLEGPVMDPHTSTPSGSLRFSFASTTPALIKKHNIDVVSIANNHTADFGNAGYNQTRQLLTNVGVLPAGHPFAEKEEYVLRTQIGGKSFIFLGFNLTNPNFDIPATVDFVKNIQRTQKEYVVAMVHGGNEYELTSSNRQKEFYRGLIDAGVDVVIAHHPHVTQEIELYKEKPIFYSLGNFIFDQYFSKDVEEGLTVKLTLSDSEAKYELMPIKGNHSQPILMNQQEKAVFLNDLAKRSPTIAEAVKLGTLVISR